MYTDFEKIPKCPLCRKNYYKAVGIIYDDPLGILYHEPGRLCHDRVVSPCQLCPYHREKEEERGMFSSYFFYSI